ncbi:MAG: hypothetical protein ABIB11_01320 [Candidatus Omnitrophota bacterium]
MRKFFVYGFVALFLFVSLPVCSVEAKEKGASAMAYEHASDEAVFHRVGDWFATVGKSDEEKAKIKAQRRDERETKRMEKKMQQEEKRLQKQLKKQKSKSKKKIEGLMK